MEKEAILALSQKENKNKDLVEQELYKTSALVGTIVGWCVIGLTCILTGIFTHRCNFTALLIMCAIEAGIFITKYTQAKKTHELVVAIIYAVSALALFTLYLLDVIGVLYR